MNVQLIMAGVVMDARIFKDATSAPALSDLSWIERKRTAKVFSFFPFINIQVSPKFQKNVQYLI